MKIPSSEHLYRLYNAVRMHLNIVWRSFGDFEDERGRKIKIIIDWRTAWEVSSGVWLDKFKNPNQPKQKITRSEVLARWAKKSPSKWQHFFRRAVFYIHETLKMTLTAAVVYMVCFGCAR